MTAFLFLAAAIGGALNSVAGGGSFVTLPALIYGGVPAVAANATSTLALWPGSLASAVAYRREIRADVRVLLTLGSVSIAGGLLGALLLIRTSDSSFLRLLPWLMLVASVTFTFPPSLTRPTAEQHDARRSVWRVVLLQFIIAIYGGYFGGGMGIMMLATLAISGMSDIHEMNGLKSILGSAINGVALAEFIAKGAVMWSAGVVMVVGGMVGGYAGASLARRVERRHVRTFVIVIAWTMTMYFFVR